MNENPNPDPDPNLSDLGRALLGGGSGSGASGTKPSGPWIPPSPEQLQALLPQYQILTILGRGGMGAVYMGKQLSLDRPVAIKILSGALEESDLGFKERFKNEARAMAKLSHPGIVAVHDFGETADGLLYIVMEYIEGTDVARMIAAEGRLHTEYAMAITAHVCDALAYAHERGIIHRDIKPANIMVGYDGVVKVADFGLAKVHSGEDQTLGLTMSGMAMGTMHFMAPEALEHGVTVDHRADLYAVGVMLYQMLTGKVPRGMFEMPSLQMAGLDPRYDGIIAKAMREDREVRYQSARELRADLDGILTQAVEKVEAEDTEPAAALPTMARPKRPGGKGAKAATSSMRANSSARSSGGGMIWAVLGVVVLLGLGVGYWLYSKQDRRDPVPEIVDNAPPVPVPASAATQDEATKDRPFVNSLGMKFVPVPGTDILMCIHETRRQDYAAYATTTPGVNDEWKNQQIDGIPSGQQDIHPVVGVNWEDAAAYCAWLSKKEGKIYRLPTDEEWSIAVGLGGKETRNKDTTPELLNYKVTTELPWGGDYPPKTEDQAGNYADSAWHEKFPTKPYIEGYTDGFPTTAPVMSFKPNKMGLYDMGGNVAEWVEDWWNAAQEMRVMRGASFSHKGHILSSVRDHPGPTERRPWNGFRCVVESALTPAAPVSSSPAPHDAFKAQVPAHTATLATKDTPFENTLGMKFVPVPGTEVLMCIHETRRKDYLPYANEVPGVAGKLKDQTIEGYVVTDRIDEHPIVGVSWEDSKAYCEWLSKKEGRTFRLPTDKEWSEAVGIASQEDWSIGTTAAMRSQKVKKLWPWGVEWPIPNGSGNYSDQSRKEKAPTLSASYLDGYNDGYPTTAPVMTYVPNPQGIYDLGGNVWEWCEDWWDSTETGRVLRGGTWTILAPLELLSSNRYFRAPSARGADHGFRVVVELPASVPFPVASASSATKATSATISSAEGPSSSVPTNPQLPEITSRIANYQKARHAQLSELTAKYRSALVAAKDVATKGGILAEVTAAESAIADADGYAGLIEANRSSVEVLPLPPLPAAADSAPARVQDLRDIYVGETSKIESALVSSLDQSLATVQASLVQGEKIAEASAVENFRREMMAAFGNSDSGSITAADSPPTRLEEALRNYYWEWRHGDIPPDKLTFGADGVARCDRFSWHWRVTGPNTVEASDATTHATGKQSPEFKAILTFDNAFSNLTATTIDGKARYSGKRLERIAPLSEGNSVVPAAVVVSPIDLMNLAEWQRQGEAVWEIEDGAFVSRSSPQGHLYRTLGFDDFELTGEARSSAEGNGGIWVCAASMNLSNPGGYEFQVCGSMASGGKSKTGSLLIGRALVSILHSEVPDDSWVTFRIRRDGNTLQGWIDGRQTFSTTLLPESERPLGRIVALQRWDKAGTVGYRGLKVTPLKKDASLVPPPDSTLAPTVESGVVLQQTTKNRPFVNTLGMKFVPVPGTTVLMCIHETRKGDYTAYAVGTSGVAGDWKNAVSATGIPVSTTDDHPVVNVTRDEANGFCSWLRQREGVTYRLPTDREWSCAAGIADRESTTVNPVALHQVLKGVYPWGNEWPPPKGAGNLADAALAPLSRMAKTISAYQDGYPTTAPVMQFNPNILGIFDLAGNVWEWCQEDFDARSALARGSSWFIGHPQELLSSHRQASKADVRSPQMGFRIVLELP